MAMSDDQWSLVGSARGDTFEDRSLSIVDLALLRLTECEVHGSDLDLCLEDWSELFVAHALPFRLELLAERRVGLRGDLEKPQGSWLLSATDGPAHLVVVDRGGVHVSQCALATSSVAVIEGSNRDLLAVPLGRPRVGQISFAGDVSFGRSFTRIFPGP
jgi:hypothetical protein